MINEQGEIKVNVLHSKPAYTPPATVVLEMSYADATGLMSYLVPLQGNGKRIEAALRAKGIAPNPGLVINNGEPVSVRGYLHGVVK